MTILHVIEPFASGVTTFLTHLTRALPQHRHIVLHGTRTSTDSIEKVRGRFDGAVEFVVWKHAHREIDPLKDARAFFSLLTILRKISCDIVHLHSSKAGFLGRVACFLLRKRCVVYTPHAAPFLRKDISARVRNMYVLLEKTAYAMNGIVVSCCEAEQQEYLARGIKAVNINNGLPPKEIIKIVRPTLQVLSIGLITRQKNPQLFNAIATACSNANICFTWIGDGELRHSLSASNITVTGWLEETEIHQYLQHMDVYLSTSAWEGLPYAVLEAMNGSCCLVLTDSGGHKNVVQENGNGNLFDTCEQAVEILKLFEKQRERVKEMGLKSKALSNNFTSAEMAKQYNTLYTELIRK